VLTVAIVTGISAGCEKEIREGHDRVFASVHTHWKAGREYLPGAVPAIASAAKKSERFS
jgi:hypothetical protein